MILQKIYRSSFVLFALVMTFMSSAWAHKDEGGYQILHARYGTAERNVDVTQTLKDLARRDRHFRMGNESFGIDPHPNHVKLLRIYTRSDRGETRTFEYREGSLVDGDLFKAWGRGDWGRDGDYRGGWDSDDRRDRGDRDQRDDGEYLILSARYGTFEHNVDVTDRLKELASKDREFRMGNRSFGIDPHPNRVKTLRIYARGPGGEVRTFEYREGSSVDGSLFRGWGRGNWGKRSEYKDGWGHEQRDRFNADERDNRHHGDRANSDQRVVGKLTIHSAHYGIDSRKIDVTGVLQSLVRDGRLEMRVENGTVGGNDPVPGVAKTLWVTYSINGQGKQSVRVEERAWLNLR